YPPHVPTTVNRGSSTGRKPGGRESSHEFVRVFGDRGGVAGHARVVRGPSQGRRLGYARACLRRDRNRQGTGGPRHPRFLTTGRATVRGPERVVVLGRAVRVRDVRGREGRLHRSRAGS